MNLFNRKPKYSVCSDCGIHFEPITGDPAYNVDKKFDNKCGIHRKPLVEREIKIREVEKWARDNWESLYPKMKKEKDKRDAAHAKAMAAYYKQASNRNSGCGCHRSMGSIGMGMYSPWG